MSNEQTAMVVRDDSRMTFNYTQAAFALREAALAQGALVGKVADGDDQKVAVAAQTEISRIISLAEKARVAAKEPVLEFGRQIDGRAKEFVKELKEEQLRIAQLVADFIQLEQARIRAAAQAENERLAALERERAQELTKAGTIEEVNAISEKFNERAKAESIAPPPVSRVEGQRIRDDWEITVTDVWLLAKAHPTCVRIEPQLREIRSLLDAGVKVAGVTAHKTIKAGVTVRGTAKPINV